MNRKKWVILLLIVCSVPLMGATFRNIFVRAGMDTDGTVISVRSGKTFDIVSGATFKIGGVAVTRTAAELNTLDSEYLAMLWGEQLVNIADGNVSAVYNQSGALLGRLEIDTNSASSADSDYAELAVHANDDSGREVQIGNTVYTLTDASSNTLNSTKTDYLMRSESDTTPTAITVLTDADLSPATSGGITLGAVQPFSGITSNATITATGLVHNGFTLVKGTAVVDSGSDADTLTVASTDTDDLVIVTLNTEMTTATLKSAAPGSGQIVVTLSENADTTCTYSYMVWQN